MGREQINRHVFTAGTFLAFIVAVFKLYDPVRKFALFNNNFQQAVGASSEIFKFMDTEDDVREKPGAQPLPQFSRSIRFEKCRFSYESQGGPKAKSAARFCATLIWKSRRARCWRWWDRAARARARWCI